MKRSVVAGRAVEELSKLWNILRFQCVSARSEKVECLTVHEENSLLRFMHDKLCK